MRFITVKMMKKMILNNNKNTEIGAKRGTDKSYL